jgi:DNA-binding NtrC family response regulator
MRAALQHHQWDLITSDHGMPQFSGRAALALTLEVSPDVPFIIVSGEIDINVAVGLMQAGARDYVQKAELVRLVPVVQRVLLDREVRNDKVLADQALVASEAQYRRLFESAQDGILIVDAGNPACHGLIHRALSETWRHPKTEKLLQRYCAPPKFGNDFS